MTADPLDLALDMPMAACQILVDGRPLPGRVRAGLSRLELRESEVEVSMAALRFSVEGEPSLGGGMLRPLAHLVVALAAPGEPPECLFSGCVTHVRPLRGEPPQRCGVEVLATEESALLEVHEREGEYGEGRQCLSTLQAQSHLRWVELRQVASGALRHASVVEVRGEVDCAHYRGLLRARHTVLLKGVGRTFSGGYYVHSVRTTLESGLLTQSFIALGKATALAAWEPLPGVRV